MEEVKQEKTQQHKREIQKINLLTFKDPKSPVAEAYRTIRTNLQFSGVDKEMKVVEVKEIKFTPNIGENDYAFKMRNARKFLEEGNKVKFTIRFRGREMSYQDLGTDVLNRAEKEIADIAKVEVAPKVEGRNMSMLVAPK